MIVSLFRDGVPSIGDSDQGQVGEENTDQDAEEQRRIIRFRGGLAQLTDKPSDEGGDGGKRHRTEARSYHDEFFHSCVHKLCTCCLQFA
jgi:hypothetical protein